MNGEPAERQSSGGFGSRSPAGPADPGPLLLTGDVMLGRGVDQILPHSCPPGIHEPVATSALDYVRWAEEAGGPIPRRVEDGYVWGDALPILEEQVPGPRIVNLETGLTLSEDAQLNKGIHYRMHPRNVGVLTAAGIDACVLANNHALDWGEAGLLETLETLEGAGLAVAGAGREGEAARAPVRLECEGGGRVLLFALCTSDSGVRASWDAGPDTPGVHLLPDLSPGTLEEMARRIEADREPGDLVAVSIHWGSNWGYHIPGAHRAFAHGLISEAGVDLVHGHSSHHPRAMEVHRGRLILYGCGDLINDYEGIRGYEEFRADLVPMYLPTLNRGSGELLDLELLPFRLRGFQLRTPPSADRDWLRRRLGRECARFGLRVVERGERLAVEW